MNKRNRVGLMTEWLDNSCPSSQSTSRPASGSGKPGKKSKAALRRDGLVVLDCVAERKTTADLASSIVDGRYSEQKHRLLDCGLRTRMYIVEGLSLTCPTKYGGNVSSTSLRSAMVSTHANHGLQVVRTRGLDHTISELQAVHRIIVRKFQRGECSYSTSAGSGAPGAGTSSGGTSSGARGGGVGIDSGRLYMPLSEFQRRCGKKGVSTAGQAFTLSMRSIPGVSMPAAAALADRYQTFAQMYQAMLPYAEDYDAHSGAGKGSGKGGGKDTGRDKENGDRQTRAAMGALVADVKKAGGEGQRIGPKVADAVWRQMMTYY